MLYMMISQQLRAVVLSSSQHISSEVGVYSFLPSACFHVALNTVTHKYQFARQSTQAHAGVVLSSV
jgi:hypothetical protein